MLCFGVNANGAVLLCAFCFDKINYFLKCRDAVVPVVNSISLAQLGHAVLGPERLQLCQCEIFCEPALYGRTINSLCLIAIGKFRMISYVGCSGNLVFMASN